MDFPELHPPHAHGGRRWLDLLVGLSALLTSMVSIVIAVRHGETMEKLVEAQSWPNVGLDSSDFVDGRAIVKLTLRSNGSGPARIKSLALFHAGRPVANWPELFRACCTSSAKIAMPALMQEVGPALLSGTPIGSVMLPGDERLILSLERTAGNAVLWRRFNDERSKLSFKLCYCSVFDECYLGSSNQQEPIHIEACPVAAKPWNG